MLSHALSRTTSKNDIKDNFDQPLFVILSSKDIILRRSVA